MNPELLTILVANIAAFILGGIWFKPKVFGKIWKNSIGIDSSASNKPNFKALGTLFLALFSVSVLMSYTQTYGVLAIIYITLSVMLLMTAFSLFNKKNG